MRILPFAVLLVSLIAGCQKEAAITLSPGNDSTGFVKYVISKGQHYTQSNGFRQVELTTMQFRVRFDSSAVYTTKDPSNQFDINKLYGFSDDNKEHHIFSARFGWRWSDHALRLFAYVYNKGVMSFKEMGTLAIGAEVDCSIRATETSYIFTMGSKTDSMERAARTPKAKGYQLYPYFGGNEPAPHDVTIWIRETR